MKAAESALVADIVRGDNYVVSVGLRTATLQGAQLVGFGAGGAIVAAVGPRSSLAIDAASFAVSAVLVRCGVRARPAASQARASGAPGGWLQGARTVLGDGQLRPLLAYSWLIGLLVIPEGLAAPYAAQVGGGVPAVGLLLAAGPTGVLIGSLIYSRLVPPGVRAPGLAPLAIAAGLPLLACALRPGLALTMAPWAVSGVCLAYQVQVVTEFVTAVPPAIRGQAIAIASSGLLGAQGIGLLLGGVIAQLSSASTGVAVAGGVATALATVLAARRRESIRRSTRAGRRLIRRGGRDLNRDIASD